MNRNPMRTAHSDLAPQHVLRGGPASWKVGLRLVLVGGLFSLVCLVPSPMMWGAETAPAGSSAPSTAASSAPSTAASSASGSAGAPAEAGAAPESGAAPDASPAPEASPAPDASPAPGSDSTPEPTAAPEGQLVEKESAWKVSGYFRSEFKYNLLNLSYAYDDALGRWTPRGSPYMAFGMLAPTDHDSYQEVNADIKWSRFENVSFYGDLSAVYSTNKPTQTTFEQLQDVIIGTGDLSAEATPDPGTPIPGAAGGSFVRRQRERMLINEAYLDFKLPDWGSLTLGKRRVFYGSAFTWSPMDVINPPRNPLEPTLMREGSYSASMDFTHFSDFTLSLLYKPKVTEGERGIPESFNFEKNLAVARLYTNQLETDINLVGYLNQGRPYLGLSLSRYFDVIEVHVESLFQRGRPTWLVTPVDLSNDPYGQYKPPFTLGQSELDNGRFYGDVLIGATYTMDDSSFLFAEYMHHSAGYNGTEFTHYRNATLYMEEELPGLLNTLAAASSSVPEEDFADIEEAWTGLLSTAPYLYQESNVRKNYLGLTFMKSKMFELIEPKMSVILNLDDLSGTLYPSMDFVLSRESGGRGTVKLLAGAMIFFGGRDSQVTMFPNKFTANLRMTALF